jgi:hypothetical protein
VESAAGVCGIQVKLAAEVGPPGAINLVSWLVSESAKGYTVPYIIYYYMYLKVYLIYPFGAR